MIKKTGISLLVALAAIASQAAEVFVTENITTDTVWTADNVYILTDIIYVEAGASLTIAPGTLIKGEPATAGNFDPGALVITRGAKIFANGTITKPIIMTSVFDGPYAGPYGTVPYGAMTKDIRGQWGGLIILGNAPTNLQPGSGSEFIEGLPTSDLGIIGGFDPDDSSGSVSYLSIQHGGAAIDTDNEINGLTLGGVGRDTSLHHIEVYANLDDGIEWFGGTANIKYVVVAFCGDDGFDTDFGWNGSVQFGFEIMSDLNDVGDKGSEQDGGKDSDGDLPYGIAKFYNMTIIGDGATSTDGGTKAAIWRDNAANNWMNSIFTDFSGGAFQFEDRDGKEDSFNRLMDGRLTLQNNIVYGFGAGSTWTDLVTVDDDDDGHVADLDAAAAEVIALIDEWGNTIENPGIANIVRNRTGKLDPRPSATGPAVTNLYPLPVRHPFIKDVLYKGAFHPTATPWTEGWTALSILGHTLNVNQL